MCSHRHVKQTFGDITSTIPNEHALQRNKIKKKQKKTKRIFYSNSQRSQLLSCLQQEGHSIFYDLILIILFVLYPNRMNIICIDGLKRCSMMFTITKFPIYVHATASISCATIGQLSPHIQHTWIIVLFCVYLRRSKRNKLP